MNEHNQGTLSVGKGGEVISDQPSIKQIPGCGDIEYYGGYLIAESVTPSNAARIVTCWNACKGIENPKAFVELIVQLKVLLDDLEYAHTNGLHHLCWSAIIANAGNIKEHVDSLGAIG